MFGKKREQKADDEEGAKRRDEWVKREVEAEKRRWAAMLSVRKRQTEIREAEYRRNRRDKIAAEIMARYRLADNFDGNPAADALRDAELLLQELERAEKVERENEDIVIGDKPEKE